MNCSMNADDFDNNDELLQNKNIYKIKDNSYVEYLVTMIKNK